jgi:hypothetical protein
MTATLNRAALSEVRLQIPRYGWPTAWATMQATNAPAVSETPGALMLEVAGLSIVTTAIRQGTRAELRTVQLVGGYGGWRRAVRPQGFRVGNLVSLGSYAADIARVAGERVALAPGVDRKLAAVSARLGEASAGALLSQACALPAGSAVVPWWVDLDGTTRLGPRTGEAVTSQAADSDPLGRRVQFVEDNAAPLLPGGTFGGATIEEFRLECDGETVRETITLAVVDEEPRTFAASMRRLMLALFGPHVSARTLYRYVVREVYGDGRIRAVPVRSALAPDLDGLRVWPGIAGGRCRPQVSSEILVQFADGDPVADAACIVGFQPAVTGGTGIPTQAELDAEEIVLANGTLPVGRGGTTFQLTGAAGAATLIITDPDGGVHSWAIAATGLSVTPGTGTVAGLATIDDGRAEVLV